MIIQDLSKRADGSFTISNISLNPQFFETENILLSNFLSSLNDPQCSSNPPPTLKENQLTLSTLIKEYLDHKSNEGTWRKKTKLENEAPLNLLLEITGDVVVSTIDHATANYFRDTIIKLPTNRNKKPEFRNLTISEIVNLSLPKEQLLSNSNINKLLSRVVACFNYALQRGYATNNYFKGHTLKNSKSAREQRERFSKEDLSKLFSHQIFCNDKAYDPFKYWLPLLGLLTGGRLNELSQLHISDIYRTCDIWVISIDDETDDKKLKNNTSRRIIPIHSKLIELGFLKHVNQRKELVKTGSCTCPRLWPQLTLARISQCYGKKPSYWFNQTLKKETLGIETKNQCFHSLRHSVATKLINALVPEERVAAITGHALGNGELLNRYVKSIDVKKLKKDIELLNFDEERVNVSPFEGKHGLEKNKNANTNAIGKNDE